MSPTRSLNVPGGESVSTKNYKLRILPLFEDDLNEIIDYIAGTLRNPIAASAFVTDVERSINERLENPESFEKYERSDEHEYPYYRIRVKNYTVFYVVFQEGKTRIMEVRRILYSRRDLARHI